eukprot:gene20696-24802_t
MTYPSPRKQWEDVFFLVVLPFQITRGSHQDRLLETYKSFTGPALAFMGDYAELADEDFAISTDATTPIVLAPQQRRLIQIRTQLLSTLSGYTIPRSPLVKRITGVPTAIAQQPSDRGDLRVAVEREVALRHFGASGAHAVSEASNSEAGFLRGSPVRADLLEQLSSPPIAVTCESQWSVKRHWAVSDRDLIQMGAEPFTTVSAHRENLRRLVMETLPTMAFQRVL